jgi:formate dehydrogenase major subunit
MNAITRREAAQLDAPQVLFHLNGREVVGRINEPLIEIARREGIEIPHLCHKPGLTPAGNCRACVVEVAGERTLAPSCCRTPTAGMKVSTDSERARKSQKLVLELLLADQSAEPRTRHDEVRQWAEQLGVGAPRFEARAQATPDLSHPAIAVNLDACIQCTRCLRACRDEQGNDVIGLAFRGAHAQIVFDMGDAMGASTCVACGECVQACPTGALASVVRPAMLAVPDKRVDSVCPFCGVGCQLTYQVKDDHIIAVDGRDGPANQGRLCVKGRYGFDYARHPHRLTQPLIRRADAPKHGAFTMDPERWMDVFRVATWEEALDLAGGRLREIRDEHGPHALAGFGSAKGSNEEAYLFQKLVRTGFGSNNVDHCTRLCHASSVVALLEGIGSGAVSNPVMDVTLAEVVLVIGANPSVNHPVAASFIKNAVAKGTRLIVCDPRRSDLSRLAHRHLQFKPDTDVAVAQRDDERHRHRRPGRRGLHRGPTPWTTKRLRSNVLGYPARSHGADLRHRSGHHPRSGAPLCQEQSLDDPVGHGRIAARARHRQRTLPDCAFAADRPDRPARHRFAPAAWAEQCAGCFSDAG